MSYLGSTFGLAVVTFTQIQKYCQDTTIFNPGVPNLFVAQPNVGVKGPACTPEKSHRTKYVMPKNFSKLPYLGSLPPKLGTLDL